MNVINTLIRLGSNKKLNLNLQDNLDGSTPLHDAILKKNDIIVDVLLNQNPDLTLCNKNSHNPLMLCVIKGNTR